MKFDLTNPRILALTAVMTALALGMTRIVIASTPIGGYIHLGDVAINFIALAFGPWVGMIAGGIGTALADVTVGAAQFAPYSLVAHGLQGLLVGWIYKTRPSIGTMAAAVLAGSLAVVGVYFLAAWFMFGLAGALSELPWNAVQVAVGAIGAALYGAVSRAYPRINRIAQSES